MPIAKVRISVLVDGVEEWSDMRGLASHDEAQAAQDLSETILWDAVKVALQAERRLPR